MRGDSPNQNWSSKRAAAAGPDPPQCPFGWTVSEQEVCEQNLYSVSSILLHLHSVEVKNRESLGINHRPGRRVCAIVCDELRRDVDQLAAREELHQAQTSLQPFRDHGWCCICRFLEPYSREYHLLIGSHLSMSSSYWEEVWRHCKQNVLMSMI